MAKKFKKFFELIYYLLREARPRQWIKNFAVYTAIIFSTDLFNKEKLLTVTYAFIVFCALSSVTYYINDIFDRERDKKHPKKRRRPIASGKLNWKLAVIIAVFFLIFSLIWAYSLSFYFFLLAISYITFTTAYSFFLKNIAIIEAIVIAMGFVFRVMAGSLVIGVPISSWLTVCTISLALLISFGRRKAEITLMGFEQASLHRPVLKKYPKKYLEVMISSLVSTTFLSYTLFTFTFEKRSGLTSIANNILPETLKSPKWTMLTIPIAFYAISRYLYLIYNKREAGETEKLVTTDLPFVCSILLWLVSIFLIIYLPSDIII